MTIKEYPTDADEAQKLFWSNMVTDLKNSTSKRMLVIVEKIQEDTADLPWLSKWFANIFKSGAGEAEKKYPSRKK